MKRILPPLYFLVAIVLVLGLHFVLPSRQLISFPWRLVGVLPLFCGCILNLLADRAFRRHGTTVKPFQESSALVTRGVFRLSRHPMYLGMVMILAGLAISLGSLTPWLVVLVFAVLMEAVFIRPEEAMVERTFGAAYREYKEQVRKWL